MEIVEFITLKKSLPRGYGTLISRKLGITPQGVSMALRGNNPMHPAIIEALKIRDAYREELIALKKSLNK
jgi:hypothetical protein